MSQGMDDSTGQSKTTEPSSHHPGELPYETTVLNHVRKLTQEQAEPVPMVAGYRFIEKIGEGGMGVVWKAWHEDLGRLEAVKLIRGHFVASEQARSYFKREVQLAAGLVHPSIIRVYGGDVRDSQPFYSMELIEGCHLDQWAKQSQLSPRQIARIMVMVCEAVSAAHEQGIIHRDLKPSNILVSREGRPHVGDFGLAKSLSAVDMEAMSMGAAAGTWLYMSPEQAQGHSLDKRTDVFSLGVILFELLIGRRPATSDETWPQAQRGEADAPLRAIVDQARSPRWADRHANAGELQRALDSYLTAALITANSPGANAPSSPRRSYRLAAGIAVMSIVMILLVILLVTHFHDIASPRSGPIPTVLPAPASILLPDRLAGFDAAEALKVAYAGAPTAAPAGTPAPRIQVGILAKRHGMGHFVAIRDGEPLASDSDEYALAARPATAGYLYVFQIDALGHADLLYPHDASSPYSGGSNPVSAGQKIRIPPVPGQVIKLDQVTGIEHVYFILSAARWPALEAALARPIHVVTRGAGGNPDGPRVLLPNDLGVRGIKSIEAGTGDHADSFEVEEDLAVLVSIPAPPVGGRDSVVVIERFFKHVPR